MENKLIRVRLIITSLFVLSFIPEFAQAAKYYTTSLSINLGTFTIESDESQGHLLTDSFVIVTADQTSIKEMDVCDASN